MNNKATKIYDAITMIDEDIITCAFNYQLDGANFEKRVKKQRVCLNDLLLLLHAYAYASAAYFREWYMRKMILLTILCTEFRLQ